VALNAVSLRRKDQESQARYPRFRNEFAAALAEQVFVVYAAPGGKIENFCKKVLGWGKSLLTFNSPENASLTASGARPYVGLDAVNKELKLRALKP